MIKVRIGSIKITLVLLLCKRDTIIAAGTLLPNIPKTANKIVRYIYEITVIWQILGHYPLLVSIGILLVRFLIILIMWLLFQI